MKKKTILLIVIILLIILIILIINSRHWNLKSCNSECIHRGYGLGECIWDSEADEGDVNIGSCFVKNSRHCGNKGLCNCYCKEEPVFCTADAKLCPDGSYVARVAPDCEFEKCPVSKNCTATEDCIVFGETGDCNCGCYNFDALPQTTGGNCFCAAPVSCECINGICEGVFE